MPNILMYCTAVCPYCVRAEALLQRKGVTEIEKVRVDQAPDRRDIGAVGPAELHITPPACVSPTAGTPQRQISGTAILGCSTPPMG